MQDIEERWNEKKNKSYTNFDKYQNGVFINHLIFNPDRNNSTFYNQCYLEKQMYILQIKL